MLTFSPARRAMPGVPVQPAISVKPKLFPFKEVPQERSFLPSVKVSVVMITLNESAKLPLTLSKLWWCDEIVVVDSGSTDDTVLVCEAFGCKVFTRSFDGYGPQKQYALSRAKNDWVLCLDADEVLSDELVMEIVHEMDKGPAFGAYSMPMNLVFLGREFRYGHESNRHFVRLFNRQIGGMSGALIHEGIEVSCEVGHFRHRVLHYSYSSLDQWYEKCGRYTTLGAEEAARKGKTKSFLSAYIALPYYFVIYYFLNLNFLNGRQGFYWSALSAQYHFIKYLKIIELSERRRVSRCDFAY